MITIRGHYMKDDNFTTVFSDDIMYTISRNTGNWASVAVGMKTSSGQLFTKEEYERLKDRCSQVGIFELN